MTAAPGTTTRAAAAGVCCVVAALAYSGAVTLMALLTFVLPAVVLVVVVTAGVASLSLRLAAASGLVAALGVAEIVNLVSGTANGPAARSTFAAAAFSVLAVTFVLGRAPGLFAAAVVGVVVGALGLGAGAEVAPVAVATAGATVVALAVVEAQDRRWTRRPPQLTTVLVLALLVGALVAAIALRAERRLDGDPAALAPGSVQPAIRPPQLLGGLEAPTDADGNPDAARHPEVQCRQRCAHPVARVCPSAAHHLARAGAGPADRRGGRRAADPLGRPRLAAAATAAVARLWKRAGGGCLGVVDAPPACRRVAGADLTVRRCGGCGAGDSRAATGHPRCPAAGGKIDRHRGVRPSGRR